MRLDIITLFPDYFSIPLQTSMLGRAVKNDVAQYHIHDLRTSASDHYGTVDDTPYGGGPGMVLKVDVVKRAINAILKQGGSEHKPYIILLTPQGAPLTQEISRTLTEHSWLVLICGHYEGFDERIRSYVHGEISIGPYVLSGGEAAALVVIDSIVRLLPGVTGHPDSPAEESFSLIDENGKPLLEYPQYTRPEEFDGQRVPDILLSGDHAKIQKWRMERAKQRTEDRFSQ